MAKMHPPQLSKSILNSRMLKGEVDVFNALSQLPDEFEVFYSRCASTKQSVSAYQRPLDFIIIHEKLGFLAIEVKGGKICLNSEGEIEQYHHSSGKFVVINPYQQVKKATIELIMSCKADGSNYWITDDTAVFFPNTIRREMTDQPEKIPSNTLCADDLPIIAVQIRTLFSKKEAWTRDAFLDMRRRLQNMQVTETGKHNFKEWKVHTPAAIPTRPERTKIRVTDAALQKRKLKWWEFLISLIFGVISFLALSWIMGNSLIHK